MMFQIQPKTKVSKFPIYAMVVLIAVAVFFAVRPQTIGDIKDILTGKSPGGLLSAVQRTISNSGKLIANVDFSNAFLTNSGTFELTNSERTKAGLKIFVSNTKLAEVARIRMNDMFAKGYFEHISPTGDSASKEADIVNYEYISIGENIAMGNFKDDAALVLAWMNSPGHRANILNAKFTELGVSVGKGMYNGKETWIAVQVFGKPLSACPSIDKSLKNRIASEQIQIESAQAILGQKKAELDVISRDPSIGRVVYNQKVDEYNIFVGEINTLITQVKIDIAEYNVTVQAFNACLASSS